MSKIPDDIDPLFTTERAQPISRRQDVPMIDMIQTLGSPFSSDGEEEMAALPPADMDYQILDNPKLEVAFTQSDSEEEEFRVKRPISLLRANRKSFVFGDSSGEDEPEDLPNSSDLALIDDSPTRDDEFSHLSCYQKVSEFDDEMLEISALSKKFRHRASPENNPSPVANLPLALSSPESYSKKDTGESHKSEMLKKREARKRVRSWKINKQRTKARKRAKILFC